VANHCPAIILLISYSYYAGEFKYRNLVENIREKVTKANVNGLYGNHFSINTAKYMSSNCE